MNNKYYMENLLTSAKSMCNLLVNGTIESTTPFVNSSFNQALFEMLSLQNSIYKQMESMGWYKVENVPITKVNQTISTVMNS